MKKKNVQSRFATIVLFCCLSLTVSAKNIYLSAAEGLDTNDGSTPELAVKTICMAMTVASVNDTIKIAGMVNLDNEPQRDESAIGNINYNGTSVWDNGGITYNVWIPVLTKNETQKGAVGLLVLNKNLTFEGLDKDTCGFDGNEKSTIFRIESGAGGIKFKNLTFTKGNNAPLDEAGPGLRINTISAISFENCNFTYNINSSAPSGQGDGGAVYVSSGAIVFKSCRFANNYNKIGSAIFLSAGSVTLDDCIIEDNGNAALASQGTVFIRGLNQVNFSATATIFRNNKSISQGGAVYAEDYNNVNSGLSAIFESCEFLNNESINADRGGGAVCINNTYSKVINTSFVNTLFRHNKTSHSSGQGGAVSIYTTAAPTDAMPGSHHFRSCTFDKNYGKYGSAIAIGVGSLRLDSCVVENQDSISTVDKQGAVYIKATGKVDFQATATVFKNNIMQQGGAVYVEDQAAAGSEVDAAFNACAFINNKTTTATGASGGAVFVKNQNASKIVDLSFVNTTFYGNELGASYGSSVVTVNNGQAGSKINFTNCTVAKNTAPVAQGTAFRFQNAAAAMQKSFYNCLVEDNTGSGDTDIHLESPTANANITIENSFFGRLNATNFPAANYPGNTFHYFTPGVTRSSFKQPVADFIAAQNSIPVRSTAAAAVYGNADYLRDSLNTVTDQLGAIRAFADNKCTIGSVEITEPAGVPSIFLSVANGLDTNDGLTPETAVKTICKAMSIALSGDVIKIDGMVNLEEEPHKTGGRGDVNLAGTSTFTDNGITYNTWIPTGSGGTAPIGLLILNKNLTFEGLDKATCGFDAKEKSTICRIDGLTGSSTFKNLTFTGGNNAPSGDNGAGLYLRSTGAIVFENCNFTNNKNANTAAADQGGAVVISTGAPVFRSCYFAGNSNKKGAAIAIGVGSLVLDSCTIEDNDIYAITGSQGALFVSASQTVNVSVTATVFKNNKAIQGGAIFVEDQDNTTTEVNATFKSCAFIDNESNSGGAVFVNNRNNKDRNVNVTFANTTFYGNKLAANYGASVVTVNNGRAGCKLNFTNCTITKNTAPFTQGTAFRFENNAVALQKSFYNCIIEDNTGQPATTNLDFYCASTAADGNFDIKNSFIGTITSAPSLTAANYPGNELNYFSTLGAKADFSQPVADFITAQNSIPVLSTSLAATYGNADYLRDSLGISTDQLGVIRPFADNKCVIGSVETVSTPPSGGPTEIKETIADKKIHIYVAGSDLIVDADNNAVEKVEIFDLSGAAVKAFGTKQSAYSLSTLPDGVYITRVTTNVGTFTAKIIRH